MEAFNNIHESQDIYVIGSGKSLDFIDTSFFQGKITIGVNQVFKKISCQYIVRKELKFLKESLSFLKGDNILFLSEGDCGNSKMENRKYIEENYPDDKNIVLFRHEKNKFLLKELPRDDKIVVSRSTITSAIHIAAYMGAKNIILVGHDCGTLNNECNFAGYHSEETLYIAHKNVAGYKKWIPTIEEQTITLKRLLKEKYDCNVYSLNPFINFGLEGHIYKGNTNKKVVETSAVTIKNDTINVKETVSKTIKNDTINVKETVSKTVEDDTINVKETVSKTVEDDTINVKETVSKTVEDDTINVKETVSKTVEDENIFVVEKNIETS